MILKMKDILGKAVGRSTYNAESSVIGEIDRTLSGNTVFAVGRWLTGGGWVKTEHVVLMPEEVDELIGILESRRGIHAVKVGETVASTYTVLAVHYLNAAADDGRLRGTVLSWDNHKREYAVFTALPDGTMEYGTYTHDVQRALNAYIGRVNDALFRHFNTTAPTITYAHVAERDKLTVTS